MDFQQLNGRSVGVALAIAFDVEGVDRASSFSMSPENLAWPTAFSNLSSRLFFLKSTR
jgi:hypothetical protein